jgi:NTP pyrophosphatase (non-canonical NTP hydrolase)
MGKHDKEPGQTTAVPVPAMSMQGAVAPKRSRTQAAFEMLKEEEEHERLKLAGIRMLEEQEPFMRPIFQRLSKDLFVWFQHQGFWPSNWQYAPREDEMTRLKKMEKLGLIITEIAEAMEAVRKNDTENEQEELADVFVRLFDYLGGFGHSDAFTSAFIRKMVANYHREFRHGKEF